MKQIFIDTYRREVNAKRRRKNKLARLRGSKRSRVRKKWLKHEEPEPTGGVFTVWLPEPARIETWERK